MALQSGSRQPAPTAFCLVLAALALAAGNTMAPVARDAPDIALRLPPDRVYDEQESPGAVVFSHENHAAFADNRCTACHPQPFSILGRHQQVRHERMDVGESCGICHNGRDATDVKDADSCDTCHTGGPATAAAGPPAGFARQAVLREERP